MELVSLNITSLSFDPRIKEEVSNAYDNTSYEPLCKPIKCREGSLWSSSLYVYDYVTSSCMLYRCIKLQEKTMLTLVQLAQHDPPLPLCLVYVVHSLRLNSLSEEVTLNFTNHFIENPLANSSTDKKYISMLKRFKSPKLFENILARFKMTYARPRTLRFEV